MKLMSNIIMLIFSVCSAQTQQLVLPGDYPDLSVVKIGDQAIPGIGRFLWD